MEQLVETITPLKICGFMRQLLRGGPAILPTDKRNKNGFTAFQFCFYREFNLLNNEAKRLYVGGWYQVVPRGPQLIPEILDDNDAAAVLTLFS